MTDEVSETVVQLFQAYQQCSEHHEIDSVIEAVMNFLAAAICQGHKGMGLSREEARHYAYALSDQLPSLVFKHWHSSSSPDPVAFRIN